MRTVAALAMGIFLLATVAAAPPRPQCCHGCNTYSCTTDQCGKMCKLGPKCDKCWKKECSGQHGQ